MTFLSTGPFPEYYARPESAWLHGLAYVVHLKNKADHIRADVTLVVVKRSGHNWRQAGAIRAGAMDIQRSAIQYALPRVEEKRAETEFRKSKS